MLSLFTYGQTTLQFQNYGINNGLSNSQVNAITEDSFGFIWVGTRSGLNRYDGYQFKTYNASTADTNSLSSSDISELIPCKTDSGIWIGTWEGGVNKYFPRKDIFKSYSNLLAPGANTIKTLAEDDNGLLWIGTFGGGLYTFNPEQESFTRIAFEDPNESLTKFTFVEDIQIKGDTVWIASTFDGLSYCLRSNPIITSLKNQSDSVLFDRQVSCINLDNVGNLWIGHHTNNVAKYDILNQELTEIDSSKGLDIPDEYLWRIFPAANGKIWIGTQQGLIIYDPQEEQSYFYREDNTDVTSLISDNVFTIFEDSRGLVWVGSWFGGLSKYDPFYNQFSLIRLPEFITQKSANSLIKLPNENILVGTKKGLAIYNPKTNEFSSLELNGAAHEIIKSSEIHQLKLIDTTIHLVCDNGYYLINPNTWTSSPPSNDSILNANELHYSFRNLQYTNDTTVWLSSWINGLIRYNPKTTSIQTYTYTPDCSNCLSSNSILCLHEDEDYNLWIGSKEGLDCLNQKDGTITKIQLTTETGLAVGVRSIIENQGILWLGTSQGIVKLDKITLRTTFYNRTNGLEDDVIYSSILLGDKIWMTTNEGISSFNIRTLDTKNYNGSNGIVYHDFYYGAVLQDHKQNIYFGGIHGMYEFNPFAIAANKLRPSVLLTQLKINNEIVVPSENGILKQPIEVTDQLILPTTVRSIAIQFAALNFARPEINNYRYRLDGFDNEWLILTGTERTATYTNLDPGKYTLRIQQCNIGNNWNGDSSEIKIIVLPSFWETGWFKLIVVASVIIVVFLIFRIRVSTIENRSKILERKVAERTKEVISVNRLMEEKNEELGIRNKQLEDSINYGQKIQRAILPDLDIMRNHFSEIELLFLPKETVSGDFYWYTRQEINSVMTHFVAVVDCTGHGVPGAFMSLIGVRALNFQVTERKIHDPSEILSELNLEIIKSLKQKSSENYDGMDMVLLKIEETGQNFQITFSGAKRPLYVKKKNSPLIEIKGDRWPIGGFQSAPKNFTKHSIELQKGDSLFLTSDGFQDQNDKGRKKFGKNKFKSYLEGEREEQLYVKFAGLNTVLQDYMKGTDQRDDITVLGIKL